MVHFQQIKIFRALDIFAIFFFFIIGIGGFIIIFNPIQSLIPHPPLLSPQDWTGSVSSRGVAEEDASFSPPLGSSVGQRQFGINISYKTSVNIGASLTHEVIWYPDSKYAAKAFEEIKKPFEMELLKTKTAQEGVPASKLFCGRYKEIGFACEYFAYHEVWYTKVRFWSLDNQWLSISDVESLIGRVNELLLSAPPTP